jgi:hypothetical protein
MPAGTPVHRHWVVMLTNGSIVIDWGDGLFQDVYSGEFLRLAEGQLSHPAQNEDLEMLKRAGRVDHYDSQQAWLINLPERPIRSMD